DEGGDSCHGVSLWRIAATRRQPVPVAAGLYSLAEVGGGRRGSLDLAAVHAANGFLVERIAPVHGAVVRPDEEVADRPAVLVDVSRSEGVPPELFQHGF